MHLPTPRGPLSEAVVTHLLPDATGADPTPLADRVTCATVLSDDVQITLWTLYQLHFRGFADARPDAEWDPVLLDVRRRLEAALHQYLQHATADLLSHATTGGIEERLWQLIDRAPDPGLSRYLQREATRDQLEEFLRQRSLYHLQESDSACFLLARLEAEEKVALAELQYDEFGAGRPAMLHQRLYAEAMDAMGLDSTYGRYVDEADRWVLAANNVGTHFALHRRLRGQAVGHLAAFEATSSGPCRRIAQGIRRLDLPHAVHRYFDEHVEADAVHEQVVLGDICAPLVAREPGLADDVLFGAASCLVLDDMAGRALVRRWRSATVAGPVPASVSSASVP